MSAMPSAVPGGKQPLAKAAGDYFSQAQWGELLDEDRFALSSVAILLASIVGLGLVGVAIVVSVMALL
jgi:hypothetical protein